MSIARVALDVPLPRLFDYTIAAPVAPGVRVAVPFGRGRRVGVVVECTDASELDPARLKAVTAVLDETPLLTPDCLEVARFAAAYYQRPLGEVLAGALPPRLRRPEPLEPTVHVWTLAPAGREQLAAHGRASARRTLLAALGEGPASTEALVARVADALPRLRRMAREGLVAPEPPVAGPAATPFDDRHALTAAQADATAAIAGTLGRFAAHLLLGVTGSGKTEVYVHAVRAALDRGTQALVLVPEISLTPQLTRAFAERFPGVPIAVLHSALADGERALAWLDARAGHARIVLGTRLAVFTPFRALGLVVVDEEHDASFKQQDGVRYSARDLAVYRARTLGVPIVLGSATPSLESYANATAGRYLLHRLPGRAREGAALPRIRIVDMREATTGDGLSTELATAIDARLARGEQTLVFLNRRGYAPVLACGACGWVADCTRCSAHLVVHLREHRLRCHHCGLEVPIPRACPSCGNVDLAPFGRGTQRLEDALVARFPDARILRIDSDSTRGKGRWEAMIERIRAGDVDILVGTQILSKGHDFPRLTLVGILGVDAALMAPDYRAPERLFAQLQQVAGRAGRAALPGEVLIQTRYPMHPLHHAVIAGDYEAFARTQIAERTAAGFPPAVSEAVLRAESHSAEKALAFLSRAVSDAPAPPGDVLVCDPVPMTLARLAGWERAHVLVQSPSRKALQAFLAAWSARLHGATTPQDVRWHFDVDPLEF